MFGLLQDKGFSAQRYLRVSPLCSSVAELSRPPRRPQQRVIIIIRRRIDSKLRLP